MMRAFRRFAVSVVALTALVALAGPPAHATKQFAWHQQNSHAAATWLLNDGYNTAVSVYAYQQLTDQFSGKPGVAQDMVGVDIYQGFCDAANNQWVDRSWFGTGPVDVVLSSDFTSAHWPTVTLTLSGTEGDTPLIGGSCDSLDWENATNVDLSPSQLTLSGSFTASGPMVTQNSSQRESFDPYLWVTVTAGRARMADEVTVPMSASDTRLTALGSLPAPDFAYVGHTIRIELTVTRGKDHRTVSVT